MTDQTIQQQETRRTRRYMCMGNFVCCYLQYILIGERGENIGKHSLLWVKALYFLKLFINCNERCHRQQMLSTTNEDHKGFKPVNNHSLR